MLAIVLVVELWRDARRPKSRWVRTTVDEPSRPPEEPPPTPPLDIQLPYAELGESGPERPAAVEPPRDVEVPSAPPHEPAAAKPPLGRPPRRPGAARVLLVDPRPGPGSTVLRTLVRAGFDVLHVGDGREALAVHASADPPADVVVADALPTGMTGAELARRLWAIDPQLAVVLFSPFAPDAIRAPAGVRVLSSDAPPEELVGAVVAVVPAADGRPS